MKSAATTILPTVNHECSYDAGSIKRIKESSRRSDSTYFVDPRKLEVDPAYNIRVRTPDYLAYIRQLADDMKAHGYDPAQPVSAIVASRDGEDVLIIRAGNTRREAALLAISEGADFEMIPVIIRPKTDNDIDQTVDLVRSNNGRPLTTYELAIVVKRLVNKELNDAEIGRLLGLTPTYVAGLTLLASVPNKLAMLVVESKVSAAMVIDLVRQHGNQKALEIVTASLAKASAQGKAKVTPKLLPGAAFRKAIKSKAPALLETAELVRNDPAYAGLSPETQTRLNALLDELAALKADAADGDATGGDATGGDATRAPVQRAA